MPQRSPDTACADAFRSEAHTSAFSLSVNNGFRAFLTRSAGAVTRWCDAHPFIAGSLAAVLVSLYWLVG